VSGARRWLTRHVLWHHKGTFRDRLSTPAFWLEFLILLALTNWLGHTRPVEVASNATWDAVETSMARGKGDAVHIVEIDKNDYRQLFSATSPLDADPLAKLIASLLAHDPQSLIVDLDTSETKFVTLRRRIAFYLRCLEGCSPEDGTKFLLERNAPPGESPKLEPYSKLLPLTSQLDKINKRVIWARGAIPPEREGGNFTLEPVLGASDPCEPAGTVCSGAVMLRPDDDGRLRRVRPFLPVGAGYVPALVFAARPGVRPDLRGHVDDRQADSATEEVRLRFPKYLAGLPVTTAGEFHSRPFSLSGRTVFLGGNYSAADWFYMADGREHPGVEVLAAATLALSKDEHVIEVHPYVEFALDVFVSLVGAVLHFFLRPAFALAMVVSFILIGTGLSVSLNIALGMILNFVALIVSVGIDQSVSGAIEAGEALEEERAGRHPTAGARQEHISRLSVQYVEVDSTKNKEAGK